MADIGSLFVNVKAKTADLRKGLKKARDSVAGFDNTIAKSLKGLASFNAGLLGLATAGGGLALFVKKQFEAVDALGKTSQKLGITTQDLAGLQHAANQTGVATDTLNMAMQRMVRRIAEAAQGTGEAKDALKELRLDAGLLSQMSPDRAFMEIAEAMSEVGSQADKVRLAFKLFDSEGVALLNTLGLGRDGLRDMVEEAKRLGIALDEDAVNSIEDANDAMDKLRKTLTGLGNTVLPTVADGLSEIVGLLDDIANSRAATGFFATLNETGRKALENIADLIEFSQRNLPESQRSLQGFVEGVREALAEQRAELEGGSPVQTVPGHGGIGLTREQMLRNRRRGVDPRLGASDKPPVGNTRDPLSVEVTRGPGMLARPPARRPEPMEMLIRQFNRMDDARLRRLRGEKEAAQAQAQDRPVTAAGRTTALAAIDPRTREGFRALSADRRRAREQEILKIQRDQKDIQQQQLNIQTQILRAVPQTIKIPGS